MRLARLVLAGALALTAAATTQAHAATGYAPLDRPGPTLSVAPAVLKAALHCEGDFRRSRLEPVLPLSLLRPSSSTCPHARLPAR